MHLRWRLEKGEIAIIADTEAVSVATSSAEIASDALALPDGYGEQRTVLPSESSNRIHEFLRAVIAPAIVRALLEGCDSTVTEKGEKQ